MVNIRFPNRITKCTMSTNRIIYATLYATFAAHTGQQGTAGHTE